MKSVFGLMAGLLFWSTFALAAGQPEESFKADVDYDLVTPPGTPADPAKVEVMEFFWYGCPHCYHFEPDLTAWIKRKPANVEFVRQPAVFSPIWGAHAKVYFTAEGLGIVDKVHSALYETIQTGLQNKQQPLTTEDEVAQFLSEKGGVPEAEVRKVYKSFAVDAKLRQSEQFGVRYGIDGTPAIVINGKYRVGPKKAQSFPRMIQITDALIKQESGAPKQATH